MKRRESVSHIMTVNVMTLNVTDSLEDAERIMKTNKIRHLPIVSGKKLVGMLSLTDLLKISFVDNYEEGENSIDTAIYSMFTIAQVMVTNPKTITKDFTIREVAEILANKEYHALPIVENENLIGIVTTTDLINYLLEQY